MSERDSVRVGDGGLQLEADVLVLGGGPAGTWAALSAVESGANVVLADKGYCGTSGATAAAGRSSMVRPPRGRTGSPAPGRRRRVATARWMYASAQRRTETRGMHKHEDFASLDVAQQRCVLTGGLDTLWVRPHAG